MRFEGYIPEGEGWQPLRTGSEREHRCRRNERWSVLLELRVFRGWGTVGKDEYRIGWGVGRGLGLPQRAL